MFTMDITYCIKILPNYRYPEVSESVHSMLEVDEITKQEKQNDQEFKKQMTGLGEKITKLIEKELNLNNYGR